MTLGCFRHSAWPTDNTKGERQICRVVATMSVCGANDSCREEGRGPANDSCRDSVAGPKTRTSDQIATDQIPTTEPCRGFSPVDSRTTLSVLSFARAKQRRWLLLLTATCARAAAGARGLPGRRGRGAGYAWALLSLPHLVAVPTRVFCELARAVVKVRRTGGAAESRQKQLGASLLHQPVASGFAVGALPALVRYVGQSVSARCSGFLEGV